MIFSTSTPISNSGYQARIYPGDLVPGSNRLDIWKGVIVWADKDCQVHDTGYRSPLDSGLYGRSVSRKACEASAERLHEHLNSVIYALDRFHENAGYRFETLVDTSTGFTIRDIGMAAVKLLRVSVRIPNSSSTSSMTSADARFHGLHSADNGCAVSAA